MLNYDEIIIRIKKLISENELNAASFAEKIGVQRSGISHILSGRNKPSLEFLSKIQTTFDEVEFDWLLLGKNRNFTPTQNNFFDSTVGEQEPFSLVSKNQTIQKLKPTKEIKEIIYVYVDDTFKLIERKS
ncbi:MAG: helix-turn-helix transcriptional regulator [Flavobacteriaceae bacterium]|nr:helix-turn-helix transcriptional regulator [Flavobacteriaceae bacterium]